MWEAEQEAERRELEAAGWKPIERMDKIVWRNPASGYLYPQDVAIRRVREEEDTPTRAHREDREG